MNTYVTDSSAFGPLLFADEKDDLIPGFAELLEIGGCIVPGHWQLEVANQVLSGLRRARTTDELARDALAMLQMFPIAIDNEAGDHLEVIFELAQMHALTVYDAAYAELALRAGAVLVTFDRRLRSAASELGIPLLP